MLFAVEQGGEEQHDQYEMEDSDDYDSDEGNNLSLHLQLYHHSLCIGFNKLAAICIDI